MLFLPHQCQLCLRPLPGQQPISLCLDCENELPWQPPGCPRCGLGGATVVPGHTCCTHCERSPFPFHLCTALFEFTAPIDRMIRRFKDHQDFVAGRTLCRLLAEQFVRLHQEAGRALPDALVPVPLHRRRLRERGFNQSRLLADAVSRYSNLPVAHRLCLRRQQARDQRSLGRGERYRNMDGLFVPRAGRRLPAPWHVAIIDDVVTSGATASAMTRLLQRMGAHRVDVWCLARVEPPD